MGRMLLVLICSGVWAQSPAVYHVGGDVLPPQIVDRPAPLYSEEARRANAQGVVELSLIVGEDGNPRNVRVRKSIGLGLDENAVAAVSHWHFSPGTKSGQPVAVDTTMQVTFHMRQDARTWHLSRAVFNPQDGATAPVVLRAPYPAPGAERSGTVSVSLDVDEKGFPMNIQVENSSDASLQNDVAAFLSNWRFQPAVRDNLPVVVHGFMDFTHGVDSAVAPQ